MYASLRRWIPAAAVFAFGPALVFAGNGDRPLRIVQTTDVRLSGQLSPEVPSIGEVRLLVLVDDAGKLADLLLIGSTHRVFTQAAVTALQEWRFEPALQQGEAVGTRTVVRLFFESRGRVVSVSGAEVLPSLVGGPFGPSFVNRVATSTALDAPLQKTMSARPIFPAQLSGQFDERATVALDFYVDETGRPRMPVAVRSEHPLLTQAAMDALDQWRFAPPTRKGQPVIVRAQQEFVFIETQREAALTSSEADPSL